MMVQVVSVVIVEDQMVSEQVIWKEVASVFWDRMVSVQMIWKEVASVFLGSDGVGTGDLEGGGGGVLG
jgi:hypothetical protein